MAKARTGAITAGQSESQLKELRKEVNGLLGDLRETIAKAEDIHARQDQHFEELNAIFQANIVDVITAIVSERLNTAFAKVDEVVGTFMRRETEAVISLTSRLRELLVMDPPETRKELVGEICNLLGLTEYEVVFEEPQFPGMKIKSVKPTQKKGRNWDIGGIPPANRQELIGRIPGLPSGDKNG